MKTLVRDSCIAFCIILILVAGLAYNLRIVRREVVKLRSRVELLEWRLEPRPVWPQTIMSYKTEGKRVSYIMNEPGGDITKEER